ncbi:MAG TPA: hypothetical protein VGJ43_14905 [Acidimicrobiales bacterium]
MTDDAEPAAAGPPADAGPATGPSAEGEGAEPAAAPEAGDETKVPAGVGAAGAAGAAATTPVERALRRLRPPEHAPDFWTKLDTRLADEPQLRLAPRAAIRPITQPPPVIDDRNLASSLANGLSPAERGPRRGPSPVRLIVIGVVAVFALLVGLAALQPDDERTATDGPGATTDSSVGRAPTSGDGAGTATTPPPPTLPPGAVDPAAPLEPSGVGPLRIGSTLGDLQAAGVQIQPDESTFRGSGGTCYDARVTGALDLRLRFRAPDGRRRASEPAEGVLAAISIESALPTTRPANSGITLGSPQDAVLAAYAGTLDERIHPFVPGGKIYRADAGNGTGIAFLTDGTNVIGISVGEMDVIKFVNDCR